MKAFDDLKHAYTGAPQKELLCKNWKFGLLFESSKIGLRHGHPK